MNKKIISKKKIAVVGLGYVGLPLALLAHRKGYEVIGIDKDESRVKKINNQIALELLLQYVVHLVQEKLHW